ncbi:MAG: DUF2267 domain-containing protein [Solirubrobacteraceae bacterium]
MTRSHVSIIDRSVETTNVWLKELAAELGTDDRTDAYHALRGVLHTLRDRLTVDEAADLASQLPELVRGIFYEGWNPSSTPQRYRSKDEFLRRVGREGDLHGETEASYATSATLALLRRHVSKGEMEDVMAVLPAPLRELLEVSQ